MRLLLGLILTSILASSCSKEVVEPTEQETSTATPVKAGVHDASFNYTSFSPAFSVAITWDAQLLYGHGSDSLDLNNDGSYDLTMTLNLLNQDSIALLQGAMPNPFPNCYVQLSNGYELVEEYESYPLGLGQFGTATFVRPMIYQERVDCAEDWNSTSFGRSMWAEHPMSTQTLSYGPWYNLTDLRYIGIRKDGKFGWIKVDATDRENPIITAFAMQQ